ncbi:Osmotically-inducible protein OsmY, contains BON domain [Anaerobranca californiensis DSM 14826]|jgi:osmotically-inducible protein OsmY|uniref:Osmotically-inducible protein OsmY, contains BON domain n=1 Tax=Anaerobranca californiensis DSM 14826 TaxID=1120989 RepID=A0A1M6MC71_9FIRM|nr:BON domain-containing protein [Anaerobranca californiensis]SHJ81034.1 Osmotically-inducible protein OsmY, contains BON domain [Anaerobranca californiensis DSM 14826]
MSKKEYYQDGASRLDLRYIDNSRPRESKSQQSQLEDHLLDNKGIKTPIESKIEGDIEKDPVYQATDNELQNKVQGLFHNDENLANYDIRIYANQRGVELTGIVDTLSEKEYAEKLVKSHFNIPVINSISISTDGQIVDDDVYQELKEELKFRNLNSDNLQIQVHDGVVTLQGQRPENIDEIVAAVKTARGVKDVHNFTSLEKEPTLEDLFHSQVNNDFKENK